MGMVLLLTLLAFLAIPILILSIASQWYCRWIGYRATVSIGCVGVAVHEIGHLIAALLCFNKIIGFSLFRPSIDGSLGYVSRQYTIRWYSPLTNFLIAMAPLASGLMAFLLVTFALRPDLLPMMRILSPELIAQDAGIVMDFMVAIVTSGGFVKTLLWFYLSFSILLFCSPSIADFQGAVAGAVWILVVLVGIEVFFPDGNFELGRLSNLVTAFGVMLWMMLSMLGIMVVMVHGILLAKKAMF